MLPIHQRILTLLREIDGICRENGIVYYLHAGTLLGAVRHGGFLPWDDDGDIIMTRENWEKFLAAFDRSPLPGRALECSERHPRNLRLFPRYLDTTTTMAFISGTANTGYDSIPIDILIFDRIPVDPEKQKEYQRWLLVLGEMVCRRYVIRRDADWALYRRCKTLERLWGRERVLSWIRERMEALCQGEETMWIQTTTFYDGNWTCPDGLLGEPAEVELEGYSFYAPPRPREFLRHVYGDSWMMAPPESERHFHTTAYTFQPYAQAVEDCQAWIDQERLERAFLRDKAIRSRQAPWFRRGEILAARYYALGAAMALEARLRALGEDPAVLLVEGRFRELEKLFGEYVEQQLGRPLRTFSVPAPIGDSLLLTLGRWLILEGRYYDAQAVLAIHGKTGASGEDWKELEERIQASREVSQALYDRDDPEEAAVLAEPWFRRYPLQEDLAAVCLWGRLQRDPHPASAVQVAGEAQKGLEHHPASARLKRVLAEALLIQGKEGDALPLLEEAAGEARDVFLRREAQGRLKELGALRPQEPQTPEGPGEPSQNPGRGEKAQKVQQKLLELLGEVDGICRRAGVPYFLGGLLAAQAAELGTFAPECCSNYIVMHPAFRRVFLEEVQKDLPPGRALDCFEVNPRYGDFSMRYCDTGSLMLDVRTEGMYRCQGIAVQIYFVRPWVESSLRRKLAAAVNAAVEGAALPSVFYNPSWKKMAAGFCARGLMALLGKGRAKALCWRWVFQPGKKDLRIGGWIKTYWARATWLGELDFARSAPAFLDGREFPVPEDTETFLSKVVSPGWNHGGPVGLQGKFPYLIEPHVPGEEYMERIRREGLAAPYARARGKAARLGKRKNDWFYIQRCWRLLCRSVERIRLREEYLPRREELRELYRKGELDALEGELGDFLDAIRKYAGFRLGIAFDSEIFRIAWAVMEERGEGKTVERILSRTPVAFFEEDSGAPESRPCKEEIK